jgi:RHS repeat-associated protein
LGAPTLERKSIRFGFGEAYSWTQKRGAKNYELSDHLGNVAVVVGDRRMAVDTDIDWAVDFFKAEILSARDFYPFGMVMPERSFSTQAYRYGFNGHERDDEVKGSGNSLDFGARIYDPRLGRWLATDPLAGEYVDVSPYNFALNSPIMFLDPDGREVHIHISNQKVGTVQIRLIGSENVKGAPATVAVSMYRMTVTDDVSGKSTSYLVTRDAPVISGVNGNGTFEVVNTTFEPASNNQEFVGIPAEYPSGTGLLSLTFAEKQSNGSTNRTLNAVDNPYADRQVSDEAKGVSIHVGGEYTAADGSQRVTGSLGCFTLCGADEGNAGNQAFKKDIENRAASNRAAGKGGAINVNVDKRANSDVILKADVNSSGKATKFKETQTP